MFKDDVEIIIKAGHGGAGKVSFYPGEKAGPDGGNGGRGGDIFIEATSDLTYLSQYIDKKIMAAENGKPGGNFVKSGEAGKDIVIKIPLGSTILDLDNKEEIEINNIEQKILIAEGGLGGKGNYELRSPRRTTPMFAQTGLEGEEKHLKVTLKLIADFGLIGLPNAGKSSLLNELTTANVKTAAYPFTTLEPNLGTLNNKIIADIPGLIEGASEGKGLGIKFLKHIEKVSLLLHCIAADSENIVSDYKIVIKEMGEFNQDLLKKKQIILLTKSDTVSQDILAKKIKLLKALQKEIYPVSIYDFESIQKLKEILLKP